MFTQKVLAVIYVLFLAVLPTLSHAALPPELTYLSQIDPRILQDNRYAGSHNFMGHPLPGYHANTCILTREAANALAHTQTLLMRSNLSLKVYDCYHPESTVRAIHRWRMLNKHTVNTKTLFYPRIRQSALWSLGYFKEKADHTSANSVDVTLVSLPLRPAHQSPAHWIPCRAPYALRYLQDHGIDMGTAYDCFDRNSAPRRVGTSLVTYENRRLLRFLMEKSGFVGSDTMWWHFTLAHPLSHHAFNIPIHSIKQSVLHFACLGRCKQPTKRWEGPLLTLPQPRSTT